MHAENNIQMRIWPTAKDRDVRNCTAGKCLHKYNKVVYLQHYFSTWVQYCDGHTWKKQGYEVA